MRSIPAWAGVLSPRGRGRRRSIPAWAGEPLLSRLYLLTKQVYPRVGGGTTANTGKPQRARGLSPRGRGNLVLTDTLTLAKRSIPAWAGEPVP